MIFLKVKIVLVQYEYIYKIQIEKFCDYLELKLLYIFGISVEIINDQIIYTYVFHINLRIHFLFTILDFQLKQYYLY